MNKNRTALRGRNGAGRDRDAGDPAASRPDAETRRRPRPGRLAELFAYVGRAGVRDVADVRDLLLRLGRFLVTDGPKRIRRIRGRIRRKLMSFADSHLFPYRVVGREAEKLWRRLRGRGREEGAPSARESFGLFAKATARPFNRLANFFAPVLGAAVLAGSIGFFRDMTFALRVDYNGKTLGCIASEEDFYQARNEMLERLINEEYIPPADTIPTFSITAAPDQEILTKDELVNAIMAASGNPLMDSSGVYLDGKFIGCVPGGNGFLLFLDNILSHYRTGEEHETVQFTKNIALREGVYPKSSRLSFSDLQDYLRTNRRLERTYLAKAGDTVSVIARRYNTTPKEIFEDNLKLENHVIALRQKMFGIEIPGQEEPKNPEGEDAPEKDGKPEPRPRDAAPEKTGARTEPEGAPGAPAPGDSGKREAVEKMLALKLEDVPLLGGEEILVSHISVTLGIQVTRRETYIQKIPFGSDYVEDDTLPVDLRPVVVKRGVCGTEEVLADVTYVDGERIGETVLGRTRLSDPRNQTLKVGTLSLSDWLGATGGNFIWPLDGGRFVGSLGLYPGHTGMDIATPIGTNVRAAKAGFVKVANYSGWHGGYGKSIYIDHGNGTQTRYAHLNKVLVSAGQRVEQGEVIGYSGSTGNSTGPHLHFEVRINGSIMAPEKFVGYRCPRKVS